MTSATAWIGLVVAGSVAVIGYRQWRTAHLRVMLDLFDRRKAVYLAAKRALVHTRAEANATPEAWEELRKAQLEAEFLFGPEIDARLKEVSAALGDYNDANKENDSALRKDARERTKRYFKEMYDLFEPYMPTDAVKPKTPKWLREFTTKKAKQLKEKFRARSSSGA